MKKITLTSFSLSITQSTLSPLTATIANIVPTITTGMPCGGEESKICSCRHHIDHTHFIF